MTKARMVPWTPFNRQWRLFGVNFYAYRQSHPCWSLFVTPKGINLAMFHRGFMVSWN